MPNPFHDNSGHRAPNERRTQRVQNEFWPERDEQGKPHARNIPLGMGSHPVLARIVWEYDGEEWVEARVTRWKVDVAVFVQFSDERLVIWGVWLSVRDVRER